MNTKVIQKAVIFHGNEMLMLRRSQTDVRRPLQWDLPGGMLEEKEELLEGVKREILEETGLEIEDPLPFYSVTKLRSWTDEEGDHTDNVVYIFYRGEANSKDVKLSNEHDKFQWSELDSAINEFEYPLQQEVLKYFKQIS